MFGLAICHFVIAKFSTYTPMKFFFRIYLECYDCNGLKVKQFVAENSTACSAQHTHTAHPFPFLLTLCYFIPSLLTVSEMGIRQKRVFYKKKPTEIYFYDFRNKQIFCSFRLKCLLNLTFKRRAIFPLNRMKIVFLMRKYTHCRCSQEKVEQN